MVMVALLSLLGLLVAHATADPFPVPEVDALKAWAASLQPPQDGAAAAATPAVGMAAAEYIVKAEEMNAPSPDTKVLTAKVDPDPSKPEVVATPQKVIFFTRILSLSQTQLPSSQPSSSCRCQPSSSVATWCGIACTVAHRTRRSRASPGTT